MFSEKNLFAASLPKRTLCLTFDDGPGEVTENIPGPKTIEIAEYLHKEKISATFFVVGKFVKDYAYILPQLLALGHDIGNHTFDHPHLPDFFLQKGDVLAEIIKTSELLPLTKNKPVFFRAPYGEWLPEIARQLNHELKDSKYTFTGPIGWDIDTMDWQYWQRGINEKKCAEELLQKIFMAGKGVILMHDSSADDDVIKKKNLTFETLKILIPNLKKAGYTFCRLNEIKFTDKKVEISKARKVIKYGAMKYIWDYMIKRKHIHNVFPR